MKTDSVRRCLELLPLSPQVGFWAGRYVSKQQTEAAQRCLQTFCLCILKRVLGTQPPCAGAPSRES